MTVAAVIVPHDAQEALADGAGRVAARRIVDAAWAGGAMPIVVVVDDPDGRVAVVVEGSPAVLVDPAGGAAEVAAHGWRPGAEVAAYRSGAAAAVASVSETSALLLWPGRMTWVDPETVTSLIEAHGRRPGDIVRPERAGQVGWPVLVPVARVAEVFDQGRGDVEALIASASDVISLELGDPGTILGRETGLDALPDYAGPPEPVGGPPPEWGAAAAEVQDQDQESPV